MIAQSEKLNTDDCKRLQKDTFSPSSLAVRDAMLRAIATARNISQAPPQDKQYHEVLDTLREWNGFYAADSRGAVAFQVIFSRFVDTHFAEVYGNEITHVLKSQESLKELTINALSLNPLPSSTMMQLAAAIDAASEDLSRFKTWGDLHRMQIQHPFGSLPLVGESFILADFPAEGGSETLRKSQHELTHDKHATHYGQQARHVSSLADRDDNEFLILGGQDGWIGSTTSLDQVELWKESRYIRVPISQEKAAREFPIHMRLTAKQNSATTPPTVSPANSPDTTALPQSY